MSDERGRRIAALYDIHGNLPALEACLADVERSGADEILIGGDVVLGPMPRETLDRLLALGARVRFIKGNCDRLVVDAYDGRLSDRLPAEIREQILWTAAQLDGRHRDCLDAWPATANMAASGLGDVLFCHATPRSDEEIFTADTPEDVVAPMLAGSTEPTIVCGHTHVQFDRVVNGRRLVNAGSVGMPFTSPGAYWLLLGPNLELMRTDYDLNSARDAIRSTKYPRPEIFLTPRSSG